MHQKTKTKSSKTKRRRLPPETRRTELLEAALQVLNTIGPDNARVEDITRAAGTAKGTFYRYFQSWQDMLAAVREHILTKYIIEMEKRFACQTPEQWWQALENECMAFIFFRQEMGELHNAIFHSQIVEQPMDPSLAAGATIGPMLEKGIRLGACRNVDIKVAAELIFSIMHTMADNIMITEEQDRYMRTALELLRSWLKYP